MRIHLGHHFYGAGNLGDDFMLGGFFAALAELAPEATFSCCVPFPLEPLRQRFPLVDWQPYDSAARERCLATCDVWLGLGGSPFQHGLSRWFIDHLIGDAATCARLGKPMFFLGVGVQGLREFLSPEVRALCAQAVAIWTRDPASADHLSSLGGTLTVHAAADVAHIFFRQHRPPSALPKRVTVVANFDYDHWPACDAALRAIDALRPRERIWLAQESRELPGAERALYATLPPVERARWQLAVPDAPALSLADALSRWPSGEWLLTARYHAALAGAWAGSKVVVIATNEKLRAAARELGCPVVQPDSTEAAVARAFEAARAPSPPIGEADRAFAACAAFVRAAKPFAPH